MTCVTASPDASFLTLPSVSFHLWKPWQETALCSPRLPFHGPTLASAQTQDRVSLLEKFEEKSVDVIRKRNVLCDSSMFGDIFPAFHFLLII